IAETFEQYQSMKVGQLKYIDSIQFINSSLASLTKNLGDNHLITSQYFKKLGYTKKQLALIYRKGVYFYNYINSHDRFQETELPSIYEFYSTLKGKISQDDYKHAKKVWKEFGCKNLGEYHDLYLKTDLLCFCPSLSWDGMLKMSGVRIEFFTDIAMHDFIKKAKCD
ncbi:7512_t:CDS:2, partial [Funneliformis geosporum]